jgi:lipopolysaccharide assembly protein B
VSTVLLVIFFLIAGLAGWWIGQHSSERRSSSKVSRLSHTYFRGLNYLLNEQQDKAIEVFLQLAQSDKDTIETQFALGHLFRRRGETDRAIRLHQSIMARTDLNDEQKNRAALALGEDYMRAGLLDRAETLFTELVQAGVRAPQALRNLISIYQSERDWEKAIEHARQLEKASSEPMHRLIAQFHCELAEKYRLNNEFDVSRRHIAEAYAADSASVRAGLIEAKIALAENDDAQAVRAFERVARQDSEFLSEVLPQLLQTYERMGEPARARSFLAEMSEHYRGVAPVLALTRLIERDEGLSAAIDYLSRELQLRPSIRGESALIDMSFRSAEQNPEEMLRIVKQINDQMVISTPGYRCQRCGFSARSHHWQCPSCKQWASIKPMISPMTE